MRGQERVYGETKNDFREVIAPHEGSGDFQEAMDAGKTPGDRSP